MIFFIIPYNKIGGAEKVHLEIIKSIPHSKWKFILFYDTDDSPISSDFLKIAKVFVLESKLKRKVFNFLLITLSYISPLTIFGCNSDHFYFLLPKISRKSLTVDLTHAFAFKEIGKEDPALKHIPLIAKRVVINRRTLIDYENEYRSEGIELHYLNRFQIIPNGIPIKNFEKNQIPDRFLNFKIGFVGRFSYEKRPEIFLSLASSEFETDIKAKMIVDKFKPSRDTYNKIEIVEGINDVELVRKEFASLSVLIVSSEREGFPLVIMEAMEQGIPVISTGVGSIEEHLHNGFNGFIYNGIDSEGFLEFSKLKINLMAQDKELYTNLSFNARSYAEKYFNIDNFYEAYKELLLGENK